MAQHESLTHVQSGARDDQGTTSYVATRIVSLPPQSRRFTVSVEDAYRVYGLSPDDLEAAATAGVPNKAFVFDQRDLSNLSTHLQRTSARRLSMRYWLRTLELVEQSDRAFKVDLSVTIDPGPADVTYYANLPEPSTPQQIEPINGHLTSSLTVSCSAREGIIPDWARELLGPFLDVDHYFLHPANRDDPKILHELRMADCVSFTFHLAALARAKNLPVRRCFGLLVSVPFSIPHAWLEFETDVGWIGADPHLATALKTWGLWTADTWELATRLPSLFWRWSDVPKPFFSPHPSNHASTFATSLT